MMMLGDKKKIAQIILSESPQAQEKEVSKGLEADFSSAYDAAAKDIIEGIKAGEPGKVSRALKQFINMSMREEEYSEPEAE